MLPSPPRPSSNPRRRMARRLGKRVQSVTPSERSLTPKTEDENNYPPSPPPGPRKPRVTAEDRSRSTPPTPTPKKRNPPRPRVGYVRPQHNYKWRNPPPERERERERERTLTPETEDGSYHSPTPSPPGSPGPSGAWSPSRLRDLPPSPQNHGPMAAVLPGDLTHFFPVYEKNPRIIDMGRMVYRSSNPPSSEEAMEERNKRLKKEEEAERKNKTFQIFDKAGAKDMRCSVNGMPPRDTIVIHLPRPTTLRRLVQAVHGHISTHFLDLEEPYTDSRTISLVVTTDGGSNVFFQLQLTPQAADEMWEECREEASRCGETAGIAKPVGDDFGDGAHWQDGGIPAWFRSGSGRKGMGRVLGEPTSDDEDDVPMSYRYPPTSPDPMRDTPPDCPSRRLHTPSPCVYIKPEPFSPSVGSAPPNNASHWEKDENETNLWDPGVKTWHVTGMSVSPRPIGPNADQTGFPKLGGPREAMGAPHLKKMQLEGEMSEHDGSAEVIDKDRFQKVVHRRVRFHNSVHGQVQADGNTNKNDLQVIDKEHFEKATKKGGKRKGKSKEVVAIDDPNDSVEKVIDTEAFKKARTNRRQRKAKVPVIVVSDDLDGNDLRAIKKEEFEKVTKKGGKRGEKAQASAAEAVEEKPKRGAKGRAEAKEVVVEDAEGEKPKRGARGKAKAAEVVVGVVTPKRGARGKAKAKGEVVAGAGGGEPGEGAGEEEPGEEVEDEKLKKAPAKKQRRKKTGWTRKKGGTNKKPPAPKKEPTPKKPETPPDSLKERRAPKGKRKADDSGSDRPTKRATFGEPKANDKIVTPTRRQAPKGKGKRTADDSEDDRPKKRRATPIPKRPIVSPSDATRSMHSLDDGAEDWGHICGKIADKDKIGSSDSFKAQYIRDHAENSSSSSFNPPPPSGKVAASPSTRPDLSNAPKQPGRVKLFSSDSDSNKAQPGSNMFDSGSSLESYTPLPETKDQAPPSREISPPPDWVRQYFSQTDGSTDSLKRRLIQEREFLDNPEISDSFKSPRPSRPRSEFALFDSPIRDGTSIRPKRLPTPRPWSVRSTITTPSIQTLSSVSSDDGKVKKPTPRRSPKKDDDEEEYLASGDSGGEDEEDEEDEPYSPTKGSGEGKRKAKIESSEEQEEEEEDVDDEGDGDGGDDEGSGGNDEDGEGEDDHGEIDDGDDREYTPSKTGRSKAKGIAKAEPSPAKGNDKPKSRLGFGDEEREDEDDEDTDEDDGGDDEDDDEDDEGETDDGDDCKYTPSKTGRSKAKPSPAKGKVKRKAEDSDSGGSDDLKALEPKDIGQGKAEDELQVPMDGPGVRRSPRKRVRIYYRN